MPFSARLDGKTYISTLCTDEEWEALRKASRASGGGELVMGWSGLPSIARTSKLGIRHFAHKRGFKPDSELYTPESLEHLALKAKVIKYATDLGWRAYTEAIAPDRAWVADTLLTSPDGNRTVAVEIQWSRQTRDIYKMRQNRYAKYGIECFWIYRKHSRYYWSEPGEEIPSAVLATPDTVREDADPVLQIKTLTNNALELPMSKVLTDFLDGSYHRGEVVRFGEIYCWKCGVAQIACRGSELLWSAERSFLRHPQYETTKRMLSQVVPETISVPFSVFKMRPKKGSDELYLATCCPACDATQGDYHLSMEKDYVLVAVACLPGHGDSWGYLIEPASY